MTNGPTRTWREIARPHLSGDAIPKGVRHVMLVSLAGRLRFEGYDPDVIENVLAEVNRQRCMPPTDRREVEGIARWGAKKPAGTGRLTVPKDQFDAARDAIVELAAHVDGYPWRGCGAATDRAVVQTMLTIAYECGNVKFQSSARRIAECAEVGRKAVRRALKSAAVRDWVRRVRVGGWERSSTWQLRRPTRVRHLDTSKAVASFLLLGSKCRIGDLWRHHGLGRNGLLVWNLLAAGPWASARSLALGSKKIAPRTAERVLARLAPYGLAARDQDGWRRGPVEPEDIAPTLRSYGAAERQRQQHEWEREAYLEDRVRRARRRGRVLVLLPTDEVGDGSTDLFGMAA